MKQFVFVIIVLTLVLSACAAPAGSSPVQTPTSALPAARGTCGDGICSGPENAQNCPADCSSCVLTNADVDALVAKIREINQNRDRTRVAKMTVYLPANAFVPGNEAVLCYFFQQMQDLQQRGSPGSSTGQGIVTWATQKQVYESYLEWNK
ncbi:MAG: hypothetical protein WC832_13415 [Anaerolineales bacterium]